jgi:hypothetical protein
MSEKNVSKMLFSKEKVELAIYQDIESDVLANSKGEDKARPAIRNAFKDLASAIDVLERNVTRQARINKNSAKFKQEVDSLGISPNSLDQFAKNVYNGLYDKDYDSELKALRGAISSLKQSKEV